MWQNPLCLQRLAQDREIAKSKVAVFSLGLKVSKKACAAEPHNAVTKHEKKNKISVIEKGSTHEELLLINKVSVSPEFKTLRKETKNAPETMCEKQSKTNITFSDILAMSETRHAVNPLVCCGVL